MSGQELNRKLAEWAGFNIGELSANGYVTPSATNSYLQDPTGLCLDRLLQFNQSLDACFKWLVPKARKEWSEQKFVQTMHDFLCVFLDGSDPALALCLAISKMIEQEVDNVKQCGRVIKGVKTMNCECYIDLNTEEIVKCDLCLAALDMYEALKEIYEAELNADIIRVLQPWFHKIEKILAKAGGE